MHAHTLQLPAQLHFQRLRERIARLLTRQQFRRRLLAQVSLDDVGDRRFQPFRQLQRSERLAGDAAAAPERQIAFRLDADIYGQRHAYLRAIRREIRSAAKAQAERREQHEHGLPVRRAAHQRLAQFGEIGAGVTARSKATQAAPIR